MPKLRCKYGFVHDLSHIPDEGWITILDTDYEQLIKAEILREAVPDKEKALLSERVTEAERTTNRLHGRLYECPDCGRILWNKKGDSSYRYFNPESN